MINPLAESLGIAIDRVYANTLLFNSDGSFQGFDRDEFTSRTGGKAEAARAIKEKYGYKTLVMVGDGSTDLEVGSGRTREGEGAIDQPMCSA